MKPSSLVTLLITSFIAAMEHCFFDSHPILDFSLASHTFTVILSNSLLWNNSPLFKSSPSHAQEYALLCKQMHSHACSHVSWCAMCVMWSQDWSFPRQTSRHEGPSSEFSSLSLSFLSFFFFSYKVKAEVGGMTSLWGRPVTRWKPNNQQWWLWLSSNGFDHVPHCT